MDRRHLTKRGLFAFVNDGAYPDESEVLFRITGTIQKTTAEGHFSILGIGALPGCLIFVEGPLAHGRYVVDITLECKDVIGDIVAIHRILGTTSRWFDIGAGLREPYARLEPLSKFLEPEIEAFARKIHDALSKKDAVYWERLYAAQRRSRTVELIDL